MVMALACTAPEARDSARVSLDKYGIMEKEKEEHCYGFRVVEDEFFLLPRVYSRLIKPSENYPGAVGAARASRIDLLLAAPLRFFSRPTSCCYWLGSVLL